MAFVKGARVRVKNHPWLNGTVTRTRTAGQKVWVKWDDGITTCETQDSLAFGTLKLV
jgi:hypothetical protein